MLEWSFDRPRRRFGNTVYNGEHLTSIAGKDPTGFLCPSLGNVKIGGRSGLSKQFAALMAQAGID